MNATENNWFRLEMIFFYRAKKWYSDAFHIPDHCRVDQESSPK